MCQSNKVGWIQDKRVPDGGSYIGNNRKPRHDDGATKRSFVKEKEREKVTIK